MKRKFYFSIFISLLTIFLPLSFGGFIFWRLGLLSAKINSLAAELAIFETKQQNVRALKKILEEGKRERERIERIFIDEKNLVRFIEDLESWAKEAGVQIRMEQALLPSSPEEKGPLFQFRVSGGFPNLFKYHILLEHSSYLMVFEKVRWERLSQEGAAAKGPPWATSYTLKVTSYLF